MIFEVKRKIPCEALRHLNLEELEKAATHSLLRKLGVEVAKRKATVVSFEDTDHNLRIRARLAAMTTKDYNELCTKLETLVRYTGDNFVKQSLRYALYLLRGDDKDDRGN